MCLALCAAALLGMLLAAPLRELLALAHDKLLAAVDKVRAPK
jgi:hypothetical protein